MKKIVLALTMLMISIGLYAAESNPTDTSYVVDLGTFTGLVAVVSFFVTQVTKLIPYVSAHRWMKIIVSIVTGILVCLAVWLMKTTPFLFDLPVWEVILYGVGAGLSGCGFYDIVKPFLDRINLYDDDDEFEY